MSTVYGVTIAGASVSRSSDGRVELSERYIVDGVSGTNREIMWNAINDSNIPAMYAIHPSGAFILYDKQANAISSTQVEVTCKYKTYNLAQDGAASESSSLAFETSAGLTAVQTNNDYQNNLITVPWEGKNYPQLVEKQIPSLRLICRRREPKSPFVKATNYIGKTNSAAWQGGDPRTWLCTNIGSQYIPVQGQDPQQNPIAGFEFDVTYEFEYRQETWDSVVYYIDPATGLPHVDIDAAIPNAPGTVEGIGRYQIYETVDFAALQINAVAGTT